MKSNTEKDPYSVSDADRLAHAYLAAKFHYDAAKKALDGAFEALMEIVPQKPDGTTTLGGTYYEIKTSFKTNYGLDVDALEEVVPQLPQDVIDQVIRRKYELSVKEYKDLKLSDSAQDNEYFKIIEKCVIKRPAKASVKVVESEKERK